MSTKFHKEIIRSEILVRPMRIADIPRILEIDELSFSLPWSARSYRYEILENPNSYCWVAEKIIKGSQNAQSSLVIGMIVMWFIVDEIHIATLAVHSDFRRNGIGSRMLTTVLKKGQDLGGKIAYLEVRENNHIAQKLYRDLDFRVAGRRKKYYTDTNEDALLMTATNIVDSINFPESLFEIHGDHR